MNGRVFHCDALARLRTYAVVHVGVGLVCCGKIRSTIGSDDQNGAEMFAVREALKLHKPGERLTIKTDSKFVLTHLNCNIPAGVTLKYIQSVHNQADKYTRRKP